MIAHARSHREALDEELELLIHQGQVHQAVGRATTDLERARRDDDVAAQGRAHGTLMVAHQRLGQHQASLEHAQEAMRCFTQRDNLFGQGVVLTCAAVGLAQLGDAVKATQLMTRALRIARRAEDMELSYRIWSNLTHAQHHLGQYAEALTSAQHVVELADLMHQEWAIGRARANAAVCQFDEAARCFDEGDPVAAQQALTEGLAHFRQLQARSDGQDWSYLIPQVAGAAGRAHTAAGEWDSAVGAFERGIDICRQLGHQGEMVDLQLQLAGPLRRSGRVTQALRVLRQVEPLLTVVDTDQASITFHLELSRVLEAQGDFAGALRHHRVFHDLAMARTQRLTATRAQALAVRLGNEQALQDAELARQRADRLQDDVATLADEKERLASIALQDPLTGLGNRRVLDDELERLQDAAEGPVSIAVLDLDHFKAINDTFGHGMGDQVLIETAQILQHACRPSDMVCRMGGEEFVVIARGATSTEATTVAQRLRRTIQDHDWSRLHPNLAVTTSIGVVTVDDGPLEEALQDADRALYSAKALGRNRVVTAGLRLDNRPTLARRVELPGEPHQPGQSLQPRHSPHGRGSHVQGSPSQGSGGQDQWSDAGSLMRDAVPARSRNR